MKSVVTKETAEALKKAGFPQPLPEAGQVWFREDGRTFIVIGVDPVNKEVELAAISNVCASIATKHIYISMRGFVFAPTATDILKELGKMGFGSDLYYNTDLDVWECECVSTKEHRIYFEAPQACADLLLFHKRNNTPRP